MALYRRGRIWHYDFGLKGDRHRGSTGFEKKADAQEYVEQLRRSLKLGSPSPKRVRTLGEVADAWFASRIAGQKSATTTAQRLKILFRHIDRDLPINQVGPQEIEAAILSRRFEPIRQSPKGEPRFPQNGTVNRDMIDTTLRRILNYAEDMEDPVRKVRWGKLRLKEPKGRVRVFTDEEMAAWRNALPDWHQPLWDFMARYGVRLSEAFFPPEAVKVKLREVHLHDTKNGRDHVIPLMDDDVPALAARKARAQKAELETIWFRDEGGELTPIHWRGFQSASREALNSAGILNARPAHDLRHHAATALQRATGNIKLVQELLNHQSVVSSARYAHATKDQLREAMRHTYATPAATTGGTGEAEDSRINALEEI